MMNELDERFRRINEFREQTLREAKDKNNEEKAKEERELSTTSEASPQEKGAIRFRYKKEQEERGVELLRILQDTTKELQQIADHSGKLRKSLYELEDSEKNAEITEKASQIQESPEKGADKSRVRVERVIEKKNGWKNKFSGYLKKLIGRG